MATGDISYTIWWTDPSAHEESYGYFSNYDVYSINWDGITNPTEVAITLSPQNYYFIYDCAEDTCFQTTYNNNSYCGSSFTLLSGRNKIVRIKPTSEYITADISIKSDGTIQFFNCNGVVNNSNIYVTIRSVPKYISNLSNGTDTYAIKDAEARTAIANKQDTLVSGTNIKTINNTSILGSGNLDIDGLPSQTNNSGKFLTTNGTTASWSNVTIPFGESTSAADAVQKEVTISEITELKTGQIIIVKPTITSTVADATLKLNNFTAYPMLYGAAAITTSTDSITWAANYPSWFRFDGSNWVFLGHGVDNNTTYSAMSVAEGTTGTKTTARSVRADYLKQIIQGTKLTGLSTSTNSAVVATDSITVGIGKLQAQVNNKVDKTSIATTSTAGLIKPDGTTITITNDGTISASAGAYAMVIVDYTAEEE